MEETNKNDPNSLLQAGSVNPEDLPLDKMSMVEESKMEEDDLLKSDEEKTVSVEKPEKKKRLSRGELRKKRIEEALAKGEPILSRKDRPKAWEEKNRKTTTPPDEAYSSKGSMVVRAGRPGSSQSPSQSTPSAGKKRPFSQLTPEEEAEEKRRKGHDGRASKTKTSPESYAEKISVEKIAMVRHDHPATKLTEEEAKSLKRELGRRAIKSKDVRMSSCHVEGGALVVGCTNSTTKEWLEKQAQELSPFQGIQLKTGPAKSLVKMVTVTTFVPKTVEIEDTKELMEALKNQSDLNTDHWTIVGGNANPNGQFLVFHIDEESLEKLKSLAMRPFVGCERITFKLQGKERQ